MADSYVLRILAFSAAAPAIAWAGAYVDTFVLPMDPGSELALGSPEFAYGAIAFFRLAMTTLGCLVFAATCAVMMRRANAASHRGIVVAMMFGTVYSVVVFALGHAATAIGDQGAAILLWIAAAALPYLLGRRLARS
jgi:hypothetical protein